MNYQLGNFTAKTQESINDAIAQDEEGELSLGGRILLIRQLNSLVGARSQNWSEYERRTNEMMKDWARAQGDERSRQYVASRRDTVLLKEDLKKEYREVSTNEELCKRSANMPRGDNRLDRGLNIALSQHPREELDSQASPNLKRRRLRVEQLDRLSGPDLLDLRPKMTTTMTMTMTMTSDLCHRRAARSDSDNHVRDRPEAFGSPLPLSSPYPLYIARLDDDEFCEVASASGPHPV